MDSGKREAGRTCEIEGGYLQTDVLLCKDSTSKPYYVARRVVSDGVVSRGYVRIDISDILPLQPHQYDINLSMEDPSRLGRSSSYEGNDEHLA